MRLTVLGPHGGELPGCRSTSFLLDRTVALDAGALTQSLPLPALLSLDHILLTHSHFDHVKDLPMLSDVLVGARDAPVTIHANQGCIRALKGHLFNDVLWPDFTAIPSPRRPVFRLRPFKAGASVKVGPYQVRSVPVSHPVESCGFLISDGHGAALGMSGDTGPTDRLWQLFNRAPQLKAVLVECSFPDELQPLADLSGHLTPSTLEQELAKLKRPDVQVLLYHLKPAYLREIKAQVKRLDVHVLEPGEEFEL